MQSNKTLKLRIERTEKTTEKDINDFYIKVYRMAENLGFKVIVPEKTNRQLMLLTEKKNEKK